MEGEDKSKKVAKEKRSVKKTKAVAPTKEISAASAAETAPVRKGTGTGTAKRPVRSDKAPKGPTFEQVQLRAYFIGERRKSLGFPGDETSDWVQAEAELKAEPK